MNKCQTEFASLSKAVYAEAKVFCMTYGYDPTKCIDWEILGDQEHHIDTILKLPTSSSVLYSSLTLMLLLSKMFLNIFSPFSKVMELLLSNIWQTKVYILQN